MILSTLDMMMFEVKYNACDLFIILLSLCGVMGLHRHISIVDFDFRYE